MNWTEPGKYRRARFKKQTVKDVAVYALIIFVVLVFLRFLGGLGNHPDRHPPEWGPFLLWLSVGSIVVAALWPPLAALMSLSHVIFSEKGVNNNLQFGTSIRMRFWAWDKIAAVQIWTDRSGPEPEPSVTLVGPAGESMETFGLNKKTDVSALERIVQQNGKRFEKRD